MANVKISELNPLLTVQDADVLPIVDNAVTKKVTAAILRSYTQGNSVLLTGAQTIAGIKTFTAQLASTVATGTAPFSVASTTKVTNLNADLLDGLSSADFALSTRTLTAGTGLTGGGDLTANRTFAIDGTVTTLTGTQTLTNKTLTSPVINEVLDSNGNEILGFTPIASATDYITIKNGIGVGVPVHISATGASANVGLHLEPKGTGLVQISDGTDTTKGIRFRSSSSATSAVTLIDAVSSAGRVITLPNATGTLALTSDLTAYVPTTRTVSTTSPLTGGGALSSNLTLSIPQASGSVNGYLSSADFATFNGKQNAITLTTTGTSGAATLVGSTLNIPNYADTDTGITSLNGLTALTQTFAVGTSGTDFGISSATSTHTFNLPTASATNRGALSSADWTTFNNKQNALTNPITGTGTTNYLPKFTGTSALGDSQIFDNGSGVTINGTTVGEKFNVNGYIGLQNAGVQKWHFGANASNNIVFTRSGVADRFVMTSDGALLVNTTIDDTVNKLQVNGSARVSGAGGVFTLSSTSNDVWQTFAPQTGDVWRIQARTSSQFSVYNETLGVFPFTLASTGAATFSSSVTTGADATINGLTVGKGGGNIAGNTALGLNALLGNTTGDFNVSIGRVALAANTTGDGNVALGYAGLNANTTGSQNVAIGNSALIVNTTGGVNTAVGSAALYSNITGSGNTAIGRLALFTNTASNNTAVGFEAAYSNTTGDQNVALGFRALKSNTTGNENTAIGLQSLFFNTTGYNNTAIGVNSLSNNTSGINNTGLGYNTQTGNFSGSVILGNSAVATASNQFVVGSASVNAGAVASEVNTSTKVWNVIINGVAQKILLA
jgi:hypothetical protein